MSLTVDKLNKTIFNENIIKETVKEQLRIIDAKIIEAGKINDTEFLGYAQLIVPPKATGEVVQGVGEKAVEAAAALTGKAVGAVEAVGAAVCQ